MRYTVPSARELRHIFEAETVALQLLIERGIIQGHGLCQKCGQQTNLSLERKKRRCKRTMCRYDQSILTGTFFARHRVPVNKILEAAYYWLGKSSNKQIETFTDLSNPTVTSLVGYFRDLVADSLEEIDMTIGGPEVIVEIDETKLGKRKYNRGHRVDGVWVLVGVERTSERKVFTRVIPNRSAAVLDELIQRHVLLGSIIVTDCWRGYRSLESLGYTHMTVNHSMTFRDDVTGACTNTVEGTNNAIKMFIQPRNRTEKCEDNLWEFVWRRKHQSNLWEGFLNALAEITYE